MSAQWANMSAAGLIVLATVAAYHSSFAGPFIFDDNSSISQNATIRRLWPLWPTLCPPRHGETVAGRPQLNLSLAINYAISGKRVWSYHAANLAIHVFAALLLFGILRRTFLLPTMRDRWGTAALPLALVVALLWAIHPLQTESVTYIVQRAESLMGLFYFLTLYCFVRGASLEGSGVRGQGSGPDVHHSSFIIRHSSSRNPSSFILPPVAWYVGSVTACLLGMASKEVMISAPLMVLLYDRTFCAGSFREAWRQRYGVYLALAGTWLLLGWLVLSMSPLGTGTGPGTKVFTWWSYLLTQPGVIVHYLRLSVWPWPLCLDYGWPAARSVADVLWPAIVAAGLLAATVWALVKRPAWGFLGTWFFGILALTSSVVALGQAAFEHRMYLSLAAVVTGVVVGGWVAGQWLVRRGFIPVLASRFLGGALVLFAGAALGILTFQRNVDYQSELSIWEDTVAKAPGNAGAHNNLGNALANRGKIDEAMAHYRKAMEICPDFADSHNNLGFALAGRGQIDEAMAHYRTALELRPDYAEAHNDFGVALAGRGQTDEAMAHYRTALELKPGYAEAHNNLGVALAGRGQTDEAMVHYRTALELNPEFAEACNNLGDALAKCGRVDEAITQYEKVLKIKPDYAMAHNNLGNALVGRGQIDEAITEYRKALEIDPDSFEAHADLGNALVSRGQIDEAIAEYRKALEIRPQVADLHYNLGIALAGCGRFDEAIAEYEKALEIKPGHTNSRLRSGHCPVAAGRRR